MLTKGGVLRSESKLWYDSLWQSYHNSYCHEVTEGIRTFTFPSTLVDVALQSLSQKSKIFASSLYTREPGCSRTSAFFRRLTVPFPLLPSLPFSGGAEDG